MLEDSVRTGYLDVILTIVGLAALTFNLEVALVLLSCALYEYLANRLHLLQHIFPGNASRPASPAHRKTHQTSKNQ